MLTYHSNPLSNPVKPNIFYRHPRYHSYISTDTISSDANLTYYGLSYQGIQPIPVFR